MRILILADIHANLAALEAVLKAAAGGGSDRVWVLGDSVGYGPQPNECLARVRDLGAVAVAGNHEKAVVGEIGLGEFNPFAAAAARWTINALSPENAAYIRQMPVRAVEQGVTLVHGTPRDPMWEYLWTLDQAVEVLSSFNTPGCAFGHTHIPRWLNINGSKVAGGMPHDGTVVKIGPGRFYLNPGSVGQPRDGNAHASYAVFNTDEQTVTFHRAVYDIEATQELMQAAGLPDLLVARLSVGR